MYDEHVPHGGLLCCRTDNAPPLGGHGARRGPKSLGITSSFGVASSLKCGGILTGARMRGEAYSCRNIAIQIESGISKGGGGRHNTMLGLGAPRPAPGKHTGERTASKEKKNMTTNLVVDLLGSIVELDSFPEVISNLIQLLCLLPAVEGTGNIDLGGGMLPTGEKEKGQPTCLFDCSAPRS